MRIHWIRTESPLWPLTTRRRGSAALAIGSNPEPNLLDALLERCAIESDFFVRDMLAWALTRLPSKLKHTGAWAGITRSLLHESDDEVARSAWRAAVILVPKAQKPDLAEEMAALLGRGARQLQLSLSRALVALGGEAVEPVLEKAMASDDPVVRAHANATQRLLRDPDGAFQLDIDEAKRIFAFTEDRKAR